VLNLLTNREAGGREEHTFVRGRWKRWQGALAERRAEKHIVEDAAGVQERLGVG